MLDIKRVLASAPRAPQDVELRELFTLWGEALAAGGERTRVHPRPQFAREDFQLLDGWWDYAIVAAGGGEGADSAGASAGAAAGSGAGAAWRDAEAPAAWDGRIRVPFSPEAPLSGVSRQLKPDELLWYRRAFSCERPADDGRVILRFEAVDYACACSVNGVCAGDHVGGYLPFRFDITDMLADDGENELTVCVWDPSDAGVQPRGKQRLARGGIWYTAQSGIWQDVWLETVPAVRIESLRIDPRPDEGRLVLKAQVRGSAGAGEGVEAAAAAKAGAEAAEARAAGTGTDARAAEPLTVRLLDGDREVARGAATPDAEGACELTLDVPQPHLWSPDDPHLYDLELSFGRDRVASYCAFRTVGVQPDAQGTSRFCLNHEPLFLHGVLDQGYWPDGLMTAPDDEALAFDIRTMRELGFNLLRKHIKVESDRFYYWCDRLGMLVWQDMVCGGSALSAWHSSYKPTFFRSSWGRFSDDARHYRSLSAESAAFREEWTATCAGTVRHLQNHPCIVTWVLFNEGWGQFDARAAVEAVRGLDPTRPIDAVSGWYDQCCGDYLSVHDYFRPLAVYKDAARPPRAFVISEFGGLSCHLSAHSSLATSYGYETCADTPSLRAAVREALTRADELEAKGLAGFVYTQLSDVEEETNGLVTYDRRVNKLAEGGAP